MRACSHGYWLDGLLYYRQLLHSAAYSTARTSSRVLICRCEQDMSTCNLIMMQVYMKWLTHVRHPEASRSCGCATLLMLQATFGHSHSEQLLQKRGPEVPNRCAEILDADCDFTGPIFHGFGTKFNVLDEMQVTGIKLFCHLWMWSIEIVWIRPGSFVDLVCRCEQDICPHAGLYEMAYTCTSIIIQRLAGHVHVAVPLY